MRRLAPAAVLLASLAACDLPPSAAAPNAAAAPALRHAAVEVAALATATGNKILLLEKKGPGRGVIHGPDFECDADCTYLELEYAPGTEVLLYAEPAPSPSGDQLSRFAAWGVDCAGTDPSQCRLLFDRGHKVEATFDLDGQLVVNRIGAPGGLITSTLADGSPGGIDCGSRCTAGYGQATTVTLTAVPVDTGNGLVGLLRWGGACFGTQATCTLDVAGTHTEVNAELGNGLTISPVGTGGATFTVSKRNSKGIEDRSIDCGSDCQGIYALNEDVEVHAEVASGSDLLYWGDACTTPDLVHKTCIVHMNTPHTLRPWVARQLTVQVRNLDPGIGTVVTMVADGVAHACNTALCTFTIKAHSRVTLSATTDNDHFLAGWSNSCGFTPGPCTVTIDADTMIWPEIDSRYQLDVKLVGDLATDAQVNIDTPEWPHQRCQRRSCLTRYSYAQTATLTAQGHGQAPNCKYFKGWSGACTGLGNCTVQVNDLKSVSATWGPGICHHPH
jgi:hypothetical protein